MTSRTLWFDYWDRPFSTPHIEAPTFFAATLRMNGNPASFLSKAIFSGHSRSRRPLLSRTTVLSSGSLSPRGLRNHLAGPFMPFVVHPVLLVGLIIWVELSILVSRPGPAHVSNHSSLAFSPLRHTITLTNFVQKGILLVRRRATSPVRQSELRS